MACGDWATRAFFFFQAEDGIRDLTVTGVQTCALPHRPPTPYHPPNSPRKPMSASHKALRPRPLVLALSSLMLLSLPAFAQESAPTSLQEVKVTGSRIPRASVEGPSDRKSVV